MLELIKKYKPMLMYLIFGVLTTCVNIITYAVCYNYLNISNVISNILAWIFAVLFAFITNKIWVFDSKSTEMKVLIFEIITFFTCRLATGVLDLAIMFVSVDILKLYPIIMKIISNVIVIILNYIASKLLIFKKEEK